MKRYRCKIDSPWGKKGEILDKEIIVGYRANDGSIAYSKFTPDVMSEIFEQIPEELDDLKEVARIADQWGYGNLIYFLKIKWADLLVRKYEFSREISARYAGMTDLDTQYYIDGIVFYPENL